MYRKILATAVTMFLLMTSLAYAANMQVNSSATPVSGGTIAPNGIKFWNNATPATYTATPKAGWTLSKVQIDGVDAVAPYTVPFDTSKIHTVKAIFAQTLSTFSLTATAGAGGTAIITGGGATGIKATDNRHVVVGPNTGYSIASLLVDGSAVPAAVGSKVAYTVDFAPFGASNHTVSATFAVASSAVVTAGGNKTASAFPFSSAFSTTLTGAATSNTAIVYQWNLVSGPAGATFGTPTAATTTFNGTDIGQYVVSLTANGVTSAPATITIIGSGAAASTACISCHAGSVAAVNYPNSIHAQGSTHSSCAACHNSTTVTANDTHNGNNMNTRTVDNATFKTMTSGVAGLGKGVVVCTLCHTGGFPIPHPTNLNAGVTCAACHTDPLGQNHGTGDAHAIQPLPGCIDCHAVAQAQVASGLVNDNSGVRSILPEFSKRSHHITGASPTNAQCAVCHLEGKVSGTEVVVDGTKHMVDNFVHLRNADDNSDFVWSGTEHSNIDNFCFSCHDSNGASGIPATFAGVAGFTGTASNPFGDTLTNGYDQVARAGVVDVKTAFTTTNASHHAVSGQRYKYRFSTLASATAWATRNGQPVPSSSQIAAGNLDLDGNPIAFVEGVDAYDPAGPEEGGHATLYEGDKFVATYIPLGAAQNVGDNSTLHCGDCHTVGQWKVGSSTSADGSATTAAIGAHGANNEYLLRNSLGTDALHNNLTYVCFNCHASGQQAATNALWAEKVAAGNILPSTSVVNGTYTNTNGPNPVSVPVNYTGTPGPPTWKAGWNALHPTVFAGQFLGYNTPHAVSAMHIQCLADSADNINDIAHPRGLNNFSSARLQKSWEGDKVKIYDYLPAAGATAAAPAGGSDPSYGNLTGIACTNCHNSGLRSAFGGIHGGNATYTDGLGRTQKSYRFMPGMGNYRYAPPGGWDGKDVSDPTLLTANNPVIYGGPANGASAGYPGTSGKPMGGCYTNGGSTAAGDLNNSGGVTYGVCNHHGTSSAASVAGAPVVKTTRSGATASFRATYNGGSTGTPTTYEPTVREATAGGTLVTRPLKY